jgi:hypothetical protein
MPTASMAATGPLADARSNHTATLLHSGKVLVTGGGRTQSLSCQQRPLRFGHRPLVYHGGIGHCPPRLHRNLAGKREIAGQWRKEQQCGYRQQRVVQLDIALNS